LDDGVHIWQAYDGMLEILFKICEAATRRLLAGENPKLSMRNRSASS
jgi:hypothetical protein